MPQTSSPGQAPRHLAILVLATTAQLPAQPPDEAQPDWLARVTTASEHRRYGMRLAVAKKIAEAGDAAVPALRAYQQENGRDAIPQLLVDAIARAATPGAAVLALLEDWAGDPAFYWRAIALDGLATRRIARLQPLFLTAASDSAHLTRIAAARGLWLLDPTAARATVLRLADRDPDPRVRVRVAAFLAGENELHGAPTLVAALGLRAVFMDDPWGRRLSDEALTALTRLTGGELFGYERTATPEDNQAAIAAFRKALQPRGPDVWLEPRLAIPRPLTYAGAVSVRSCRHGDLFLRFTTDGIVVAGLGGHQALQIPAATWRPLQARLAEISLPESTFGRVVCDFAEVQLTNPPSRWKIAPAAMPAALMAWLDALREALASSTMPQIATEFERRLPQFRAAAKPESK